MKKLHYLLIAQAALLLGAGPQAAAQEPVDAGLVPPVSTRSETPPIGATHPLMKLTPDKSELIYLEKDVVSVIVGNPTHLNALLDTSRILVLIPRAPGATYFTALDVDGNVIMQRHVVVAAPQEKYVRVRRSCINAAAGADCQATSVYFCPDMCHEIDVTQIREEVEDPEAVPEQTPQGPGLTTVDGETVSAE